MMDNLKSGDRVVFAGGFIGIVTNVKERTFIIRIADNVKLSLKGINVTNEATTGYTMDPSFPTMYELSGRRYSLGVRVDF